MHENVGKQDQMLRALSGPLLMLLGYRHRETGAGLATLIGGAVITTTALTRVCPVNALLGMDTRQPGEERVQSWRRSEVVYQGGRVADVEASTGLPPVAEARGEEQATPAPD